MKDLLVIWMVVRISFEAVVWANLVWTRRSPFIRSSGYLCFGSFSRFFFFSGSRSWEQNLG